MIYLDANVLEDYLVARESAVAFVEEEHADERFVVSSVTRFELYLAVLHGYVERPVVDGYLDTMEVVAFDDEVAENALTIQEALADRGVPLSTRDVMHAAAADSVGAPIATNDADFHRDGVADVLNVVEYARD